MKHILKRALVSFGVVVGLSGGLSAGLAAPAWAETPQTDVAFVEQLGERTTHDVLKTLQLYYDLHVSEIEVQLMREQNTGAFLAARNAENDGDAAEAKRQTEMFEATKGTLDAARADNVTLRQTLSAVTGIEFAEDLSIAPDAPEALAPAPADAPADLAKARDDAWRAVEQARTHLRDVRLQLLADQEEYDRTRKVKIGDSMRAMTKAEVAMARAACDLRLVEAKIAAATGRPIGEALSGL